MDCRVFNLLKLEGKNPYFAENCVHSPNFFDSRLYSE